MWRNIMNVKIDWITDPDDKNEKLLVGATLDCSVSELLTISAALYDMGHNEKRDNNRIEAIELKEDIRNAINRIGETTL